MDSLLLHSVNLDLNGYLFKLPAVYSELASGNFIELEATP